MRLLLFLCGFFLFTGSSLASGYYLRFRVAWEFIPVGRIELWLSPPRLTAYAYTTGIGAWIFPFRSLWRTEIDARGFPRRTVIEVLERGHPKRKEIVFFPEKGRVEKRKITPKKERREVFRARLPAYDELSAFYAVLKHPFRPGETWVLSVFAGEGVHPTKVTARDFEKVKTFRGWEKALRLDIEFSFESELIRRSRRAKLYVREGLPLAGEGDISLGHLNIYLDRVSEIGSAPPPPASLLQPGWQAPD
ncbi:DUF3108 domain-containing protein [Thermosulfurimonas marina]|uniref:DUF3108 domain-containing protein n=1 Tax=Thermosulfurimonas marina TaxID=2047767 RepID=A0A6H1WS18_9BACT|nr:DUF3108 domain-containing protein [Thermosulfurimonas marina]QJA05968.1 DUF3108 domain-containing protein [Thermosulfurimonas marina]